MPFGYEGGKEQGEVYHIEEDFKLIITIASGEPVFDALLKTHKAHCTDKREISTHGSCAIMSGQI